MAIDEELRGLLSEVPPAAGETGPQGSVMAKVKERAKVTGKMKTSHLKVVLRGFGPPAQSCTGACTARENIGTGRSANGDANERTGDAASGH